MDEATDWSSALEQSRKASGDSGRYHIFSEHVMLIRDNISHLPALRVGFSLVSFQTIATGTRRRIQKEAYEAWVGGLIDILTTTDESVNHQKRRRLSSKVLNNLVTDNETTSLQLFQSDLRLEPKPSDLVTAVDRKNWVDMILFSRSDRPSLAAVLSCLHNCLHQHEALKADIQQSTRILIPTLLRQLIQAGANGERDSASDWIVWIVTKFPVQALYELVSSSITVPEHVVLLLIYKVSLEERHINQLQETDLLYLVEKIVLLEQTIDTNNDKDDGLVCSVCHLIVEILCESIVDSSNTTSKEVWGPRLLPILINRIAVVVDSWHKDDSLVRDRHLPEDTKRWIVNSVRCIGLLCHNSSTHQDLLRELKTTNTQRTGLHVLLSSTSLSPACFTVREWAVVAIRYALENCELNQAAVARLQAQNCVQSSELNDMGVQIGLDQGKVTVKPIEEEPGFRTE